MSMKIIYGLAAVLLLATATPMSAQCDIDTNIEACAINEIVSMGGRQARTKKATSSVAAAEEKVVNSNRATTPPDPFAARLHASYQDFLVPLSFAINEITESDDGRALVLRFNPFREPPVVAGLTVTASKPQLDARVSPAIPELDREAAIKRLDGKFEDLDDLTLAGSLALETNSCNDTKAFCWGRNPKTYNDLLSRTYVALASPGLGGNLGQAAANTLRTRAQRVMAGGQPLGFNTPISSIEDPAARNEVIRLARALIDAELKDSEAFLTFLEREGIDQLASLLDNQPQFAFTATWHERNLLAGPQEAAYTIEYQVGLRNLNGIKRNCKTTFVSCLGDSLRTAINAGDDFSDKIVFSASYKDVDRYRVTGDDVGVAGFAPLDVPRHREVSAKLQWGQVLRMRVGDQHPRIDVNAEGIRITDGSNTRKKNNWIGTATLTIPLMKNMSIPLSLKYGNRRELLGDVDDELSAHFGISYRLPWEMEQK